MACVRVNSADLVYDEAGGGEADGGPAGRPAVVLLHAGIADRRMWRHQVPALAAARHRVVAVDLPGSGESGVPSGPWAYHDGVAGLLDALGIDRAVLVGCSIGGAVAVDTALARPDRVRGLVLVGSGLSGHDWSPEFLAMWDASVEGIDEDDLLALAEAQTRLWVAGPGREPAALDPQVWRLSLEMGLHALTRERDAGGSPPSGLEPPAAGRLGEISVPTLVVLGLADVPEIGVIADRLVGGIRGARRVDLPDTGHLPPLERPEQFDTELTRFLATLG